MKKILIFAGAFITGGVESVIMNILRNADKNKFSFDIVVLRDSDGPFDRELETLGVSIIKHPTISAMGAVSYYKSICGIMKTGQYDVVHVNGVLSSAINIYAAKRCKIQRRIYHAHNTKDSMTDRIANRYIKQIIECIFRKLINKSTTKRIACGKQAAEFVYGVKYLRDVEIIHNAIDIKKFVFSSSEEHNIAKRRLLFDDRVLLLGNAARFTKVKNQLFLIKILEIYIKTKSSDIGLCLAGEGEELEKCKNYVKRNGLENKVHFMGNVNDLKDFYAAIDIFLLPSLYEGLPVSIIEAQACGVPVLMSDNITQEADLNMGLCTFCH